MFRVGLSRIDLLSSASISVLSGFSPASLFAASEPGVWYDPSDFSTMFQDTAGTTPVTATGQSVALMLDKSLGLVLGPELVTNGDFSNGTTGWTGAGDSFSISGGVATLTRTTTFTYYQSTAFNVVAGRSYRITGSWLRSSGTGQSTVQVRDNASGLVRFQQDGTPGAAFQPFQYLWTPTVTETVYVRVGVVNAAATVQFDAISVKELPGNHATQSSASSRPILGRNPVTGTRNLLTRTEEFDNAAWQKLGASMVTGAQANPVNGANDAQKLMEDTSTGIHRVFQTATIAAATYTFSFYAKSAGRDWIYINTSGAAYTAFVNISTGAVGTTVGSPTVTMTSAGNGWYRVAMTYTNAAGGASNQQIWLASNSSTTSYTGDGSSGVLIWGAQLETGSTATAYQKVVAATDVTESGVRDSYYLLFDGSDDFLVTGTITPGTDKAQVFAGVRKLSDAATGLLVESSPTIAANNGAILMSAPFGAAANYDFQSKGTAFASAVSLNNFASPITNVVTGLSDISGDSVLLRVNGTQVAADTSTDQGTGNYLAYPLYIGRRGGTSLPYNGRLYGLVTRFGANLTDSQITQTENWMAGKTGVYNLDQLARLNAQTADGTLYNAYAASDASSNNYLVNNTVLAADGTSYSVN